MIAVIIEETNPYCFLFIIATTDMPIEKIVPNKYFILFSLFVIYTFAILLFSFYYKYNISKVRLSRVLVIFLNYLFFAYKDLQLFMNNIKKRNHIVQLLNIIFYRKNSNLVSLLISTSYNATTLNLSIVNKIILLAKIKIRKRIYELSTVSILKQF